jgi:hypothetical protein
MGSNKIAQPLLIVFSSFLILLLFSFFAPKTWLNYGLNPVELFSDIQTSAKVITDSVSYDTTIIVKRDTVFRDPSDIIDYRNDSALHNFFASLNKTKVGNHQTRIAYFGDSFIEGDLITQDFRSLLQNEFGGGGVGYVPITSIVAGFRQSVLHSFEGWNTYSLVDAPPQKHCLFISGYTFCPLLPDSADTTKVALNWVKYSAVSLPRLNSFNTIKLLY